MFDTVGIYCLEKIRLLKMKRKDRDSCIHTIEPYGWRGVIFKTSSSEVKGGKVRAGWFLALKYFCKVPKVANCP